MSITPRRFVYLAGPIAGCTHEEAKDWREYVAENLKPHGIIGISPLRCEPIVGEVYALHYTDPKFGTARAISSKNKFDTRNCDMVLCYFPKPPKTRHQSYGTLIELGWADMEKKAIVVVTDDPEIGQHAVALGSAGWVLTSLDEGIEVIVKTLGAYTGGSSNV